MSMPESSLLPTLMRASGSWRTTGTSRLTSIPSIRRGCGPFWTHPGKGVRASPYSGVVRELREAPLHVPPLRLRFDQGQELQVGEIVRRREGPCFEEPFGVLARGDAH